MKPLIHGRDFAVQATNPTSTDIVTAALLRRAKKKAPMDKRERSLDPLTTHLLRTRECHKTRPDSKVQIADPRMARLLLVLHEIDEAVAGLEELPQPELIQLVSSAILACGFVDGTDARKAIVAVLESIEGRDAAPECS